ncbi:MAG: hypothetical protein NTX72_06040 [Candidatus Uhrbacteria bacterium]|nr:hypothetical protein [Candidatus Uhrbacteria bacterium]
MDLFICAQDIQFITFGLVKDRTLFCEKAFEVPPEKYLFSLDVFLSEQHVAPVDVSRILIVNGPGSFTASRVSVVMANSFAFVQQIPMCSIENPERRSLAELLPILERRPDQAFVVPAYDRPPNIT